MCERVACLQVRVEIADLTNTCQHSRQGKRVGVELRPVQGGSGKLRLVLELQKQVRLRSHEDSVRIRVPGERFCSVLGGQYSSFVIGLSQSTWQGE